MSESLTYAIAQQDRVLVQIKATYRQKISIDEAKELRKSLDLAISNAEEWDSLHRAKFATARAEAANAVRTIVNDEEFVDGRRK